MFKKLKQKIEEGGEVGLDKVSFSPVKLPGSIVRSNSPRNAERVNYVPGPGRHQASELDTVQLESQLPILREDEQSGEIPNHLHSASHNIGYQAQLEARIQELQQANTALVEKVREECSQHGSQLQQYDRQLSELDKQKTELQIQVVELELEKATKIEASENKYKELQEKFTEWKIAANDSESNWELQMQQRMAELEEKEKCIIEEQNRYYALEKKAHHFQSQLEAYENASENEVANRLHHEVADLEQRIKSRNLEIQILERRLASQAKESEDQIAVLLDKQEQLERSYRDAICAAKEDKLAKKQLEKELDRLHQNHSEQGREKEEVKTQLALQTESKQKLATKYESLHFNYEKKIQDLDHQIEDKDKRINELLHHLKHSDGPIVEPMLRPPGVARRTASIGIQTRQESVTHIATINGPSLNGPLPKVQDSEDELCQLQCKLEEELAEKVKVIKVQQQKIMDLKKELRLQMSSLDQKSCVQHDHSPSPPLDSTATPDVNFQYLKHVVMKFICSREDEALQLIRAVSTLLEFSPQEEQRVKQYLNYKMSWFGVIPPPLFPPNTS